MAQQTINNGETGLSVRTKINENFGELFGLVGAESAFSFVNSKDDFPDPVGGVITIPAGSSYYITTLVDLEGDRLSFAGAGALIGSSAEISRLTSTGLDAGTPLLSSAYSLNLSRVQIEGVGTGLSLNATDNANQALDWGFVNFLNVDNIGIITAYTNFIATVIGFLNSSNLEFAGTIGTVGFSDSFFDTDSLGTAILFDPSAIITRRVRIDKSAFVTLAGETSISLPEDTDIPVDGYILTSVNFAGGGTYLSGVQSTSLKANVSSCSGITNTTYSGGYSMQGNATATIISTAGVAVKVLGTSIPNSLNQKFTSTNNRLTYVGAKTGFFKFDSPVSFTSGNNKKIGFYVAKNGVVIPESEIYRTTSGSSNAGSLTVQALLELETDDYLEIWTENETDTTSVTVLSMNPIATEQ